MDLSDLNLNDEMFSQQVKMVAAAATKSLDEFEKSLSTWSDTTLGVFHLYLKAKLAPLDSCECFMGVLQSIVSEVIADRFCKENLTLTTSS